MEFMIKQLIKERREALGLTQSELADKLGVARTTVTMIESDENYRPSVDVAKRLANELGMKWTDFFEEEGEKTMNDLQIFNNTEFGSIRTIMIENEPWFVGKDVAEILGYSDTFGALKKHVDDEDKQNFQIDSFESPRGMTIIKESGFYSLVLSSKLPTAKKFKRWVTSEVLPTLRRTGSYSIKPKAVDYTVKVFPYKGQAVASLYQMSYIFGIPMSECLRVMKSFISNEQWEMNVFPQEDGDFFVTRQAFEWHPKEFGYHKVILKCYRDKYDAVDNEIHNDMFQLPPIPARKEGGQDVKNTQWQMLGVIDLIAQAGNYTMAMREQTCRTFMKAFNMELPKEKIELRLEVKRRE